VPPIQVAAVAAELEAETELEAEADIKEEAEAEIKEIVSKGKFTSDELVVHSLWLLS